MHKYACFCIALFPFVSSSAFSQKKNEGFDFTNAKVLSYHLVNEWGNRDSAECVYWEPPTKQQIVNVMGRMKRTTIAYDYERHADYSCNIEGEIRVSGKVCKYEMNAGGYFFLFITGQKEPIRYCAGTDTSLKKYFYQLKLTSKK